MPLRRRTATPEVVFIALAFGLSWLCWAVAYLGVETQPLQSVFAIAGGLGPPLAAVIVSIMQGNRSVRWLLAQLVTPFDLRWYGVALGVAVLFPLVVTVIAVVYGIPLALETLPTRIELFFIMTIYHSVINGGQEELGWRGFLLPRLQQQYSAFFSSLLVGVVWSVWHFPLFVLPGGGYVGDPFALYVLSTLSTAVIFTWVYNGSGGALPVVMVLHGAFNSRSFLIPMSSTALQQLPFPRALYGDADAVFALPIVVVLLVCYGSATLAPNGTVTVGDDLLSE